MNIDDIRRLQRLGYTTDAYGQAITGGTQLAQSFRSKDAADFQADQLDVNAGNTRASAQRVAENEAERADLVASRALAVAAASGGGASDPGVVSIMAKMASEGAYRQQTALYEGNSRAVAMENAANAKRFEGKQARVNGALSAAGSIFGASTTLMKGEAKDASLFARFGMGAPVNTYGMDRGFD